MAIDSKIDGGSIHWFVEIVASFYCILSIRRIFLSRCFTSEVTSLGSDRLKLNKIETFRCWIKYSNISRVICSEIKRRGKTYEIIIIFLSKLIIHFYYIKLVELNGSKNSIIISPLLFSLFLFFFFIRCKFILRIIRTQQLKHNAFRVWPIRENRIYIYIPPPCLLWKTKWNTENNS